MSELPKGWIYNRIDEFSDVNIRPKKGELSDTLDVSFIPMKVVEAEVDKIRLIETKLVEQVKKGYTPIKENDVIFAKVTPCMENGKIAVASGLKNGYAFGSSEFYTLRAKNENVAKFLQLYLIQHSFRQEAAQNMTGAVGLRRVPKSYLSEQKIPTPPLSEQKRIVKKLDGCQQQIDSSSEALVKLPQLLADYRASLLASAFRGDLTAKWRAEQKAQGIQHESAQDLLKRLRQERQQQWQKTELQKYEAKGKTPPKGWESKYEEAVINSMTHGIPKLWSVASVDLATKNLDQGWSPKCNNFPVNGAEWGVIKTSSVQKIRFEEKENKQLPLTMKARPHLKISVNDILITRAGPRKRAGITCIVKNISKSLMICDKVYRLKPLIDPDYLCYALNSHQLLKLLEEMKSGISDSGVNINQKGFKQFPIPIPPISEQAEIVRILETAFAKIDTIESLHNKLTTEHTQLTQSLLAKAFRGELVPQKTNEL